MLEFVQNQPARVPIRLLNAAGQPVIGVAQGSVSATIEKADGTTVNVVLDGVNNSWSEVSAGAFAGQGKYDLVLAAANMSVLGPLVISVIGGSGNAMGLVHVVANLPLTQSQVAAAVWDESLSAHSIVGSAGAVLGTLDRVPPGVSNFVPSPNTPILANGAVQFDVTDNQNAFRRILVAVSYGAGATELVYDGTVFRSGYQTGSTRTSISGGSRFSIKRDLGWTASPTFEIYAIDTAGNEAP